MVVPPGVRCERDGERRRQGEPLRRACAAPKTHDQRDEEGCGEAPQAALPVRPQTVGRSRAMPSCGPVVSASHGASHEDRTTSESTSSATMPTAQVTSGRGHRRARARSASSGAVAARSCGLRSASETPAVPSRRCASAQAASPMRPVSMPSIWPDWIVRMNGCEETTSAMASGAPRHRPWPSPGPLVVGVESASHQDGGASEAVKVLEPVVLDSGGQGSQAKRNGQNCTENSGSAMHRWLWCRLSAAVTARSSIPRGVYSGVSPL